tara:strand:+ start:5003 stop:5233 length:231 start_codon:yes stop_codon:yes gene_type:complete
MTQQLGKRLEKKVRPFENGDWVRNRFSGEWCKLNGMELAVHNKLFESERIQDWITMNQCREWFMKNNPDAYMTLID